MGKTYEALLRAERENPEFEGGDEFKVRSPSPRPSFLQRWRHRRRELEQVAQLPADTLAEVLEQVDSLGLKMDAFEETFRKKLPEVESRLLHLLATRLERLELDSSASVREAIYDAIQSRFDHLGRRAVLGYCLIVVLSVAVLLK